MEIHSIPVLLLHQHCHPLLHHLILRDRLLEHHLETQHLVHLLKKASDIDKISKRQATSAYERPKERPKDNVPVIQSTDQSNKIPIPKEIAHKPAEEHQIDMPERGVILLPPPAEKVIAEPIIPSKLPKDVAALAQYTNSFGQENPIGVGILGSVYRAELPDGKVLLLHYNC
ncbi:hypothetical protein ACLOJK_015191 [Asimina triloba]